MPREQRRQNPFFNFFYPNSLDSCGAMGASMLRARTMNVGPDLTKVTDRWADYVHTKQFRLPDGTLARNSPFPNSLWADDMYMGIPIMALQGKVKGDTSYIDDASKQVVDFGQHLFVPDKGLFAHGWHAGDAENHPRYYWARANGWCLVAMAELLNVMPDDHPMRNDVLKLYRAHARGLAEVQSGDGLWHQVLDRPDSYLETSATAMFTMAIARGANKGWLNPTTYGPVALAGWAGLVTKVSPEGKLGDVCVGTNYADDFIYYYHRPAVDDLHGYGPVLMAGAEITKLVTNDKLRIQSGANRPNQVSPRGEQQRDAQ
jgi:unsaturated rhamnogalacturonyl hydrolase